MDAYGRSSRAAENRLRSSGWRLLASVPLLAVFLVVVPRYRALGIWGFVLAGVVILITAQQWHSLRRIASDGWTDTSFAIFTGSAPVVLMADDGTAIAVSNYSYFGPTVFTRGLVDGTSAGAYARRGDRFAVFLDSRPERIVRGRLPPPPAPT